MKLTTPFTILNNSLHDVWKMHDFNYQLPKDLTKEYWDEECILHPTNSHCKIFDAQQVNKNKIYYLGNKKATLSGFFKFC